MKISYEQLDNAATNGGNLLENVANGARGAVCGAYNTYKDWYNQNIGIDTFQGALLEGFWNNVCPLEPPYQPPTLPPPPFTGGQCCGVDYYVYLKFKFKDGRPDLDTRVDRVLRGKILGIITESSGNSINGFVQFENCAGVKNKEYIFSDGINRSFDCFITRVESAYGAPDNCGNPPSPELPPPIAPPDKIDKNITINHNGNDITIPLTISPKIQLPGLIINNFIGIFKPEFNANFNPQFNLNPNFNPTINLNFGSDGVDVGLGLPPGSNPDGFNIDFGDTINNIENTVNNIDNNTKDNHDNIEIIKNKLNCDPCEKLEDIKKILTYQPVYRSNSINNFQSITRDDLFNLGYLEIELINLPTSTKIVFGNNAPNSMFTGWLFWRMNGYNFEKVQISSDKSVYWAPKWANGFAICCTHGAKANCYYYIEQKD